MKPRLSFSQRPGLSDMESSVQVLVPTDPAPKPKNPWGTAFHATPTPCSLASVMDEELAHKLQTEENDRVGVFEGCGLDHVGSLAPPTESQDTGDDQLLARMLQLEFDREHDLLLHAEEKQYNRDSKGGQIERWGGGLKDRESRGEGGGRKG